jgi:hypothetical protein
VLWTAGTLLALALGAAAYRGSAWFHDVQDAIYQYHRAGRQAQAAGPSFVEQLGGPERATLKLRFYMALPERIANQRSGAAELLGFCGPPAVPALIVALGDMSGTVSTEAARALGNIGPEAHQAVPALEKLAKTADGQLRAAAAEALRKIRGEEAAPERRGDAGTR